MQPVVRRCSRCLRPQPSAAEPHSPGRSIGLERHAGRRRTRLDQRQVVRLAALREESKAVPHHDGVEPQVELVDEVALEQPTEQDAAAMDLELASGFALSSRTAASTSPSMTWVFCQVGSVSVVEGTYLGRTLMPWETGSPPSWCGQYGSQISQSCVRAAARPHARTSRSERATSPRRRAPRSNRRGRTRRAGPRRGRRGPGTRRPGSASSMPSASWSSLLRIGSRRCRSRRSQRASLAPAARCRA